MSTLEAIHKHLNIPLNRTSVPEKSAFNDNQEDDDIQGEAIEEEVIDDFDWVFSSTYWLCISFPSSSLLYCYTSNYCYIDKSVSSVKLVKNQKATWLLDFHCIVYILS